MRAFALLAALGLALASCVAGGGIALANPISEPTGLLVRTDDDGNQTLLLHVEDAAGGVVTYTKVVTGPTAPRVRELGAYTRLYEGFEGAPTISAGVYVYGDAGRVRIPLVIVENAASTADVTADLTDLVTLGLQTGNLAIPFAQEILVPEMAANFAAPPDALRASSYRDQPTTYVWQVHRAGAGGEVWAGQYLARTGSVTTDAGGAVRDARADAELGIATRVDGATVRAAGAFLESTYTATPGQQAQRITSGLVAGGLRAPLASLDLADARAGASLAEPSDQATRATLGIHAAGAFVPLVGVETTNTAQPSQTGNTTERITSVGAYGPDGAFVKAAGVRYHSDTTDLTAALLALAIDGAGSKATGDFVVDVGPFVEGEYVPLAGAIHRDHFREMRYSHASLLGVGLYTPLGFSPVAVATYDGSMPLVEWAFALANGVADGSEWLIAAGTMAAGTYVPLVGVGTAGAAPLQERAEAYEVRAGVFVGSYRAFVPVASLAYDGDRTPAQHALALAFGGGAGAEAGAFDVRLGVYAANEYAAIAGAGMRSDFDGAGANETLVVIGTYVDGEFVPLAGVLYQSNDHAVGSLNNVANANDDDAARVYAGLFVAGTWTPLLMVENSGEGVRIVPAP